MNIIASAGSTLSSGIGSTTIRAINPTVAAIHERLPTAARWPKRPPAKGPAIA